ncbi:MAG: type II toxin-antitoxin system VapC family toxin [Saprospiraceae bacterium]|nr:type II toxin-antitoxin system VapC family toxin [Saprospiraceae bacterium]
MIYLLDTNIIIYHLNGLLPDDAQKTVNEMLFFDLPLSIITKIELMGFKFDNFLQKEKTVQFLNNVNFISVSNQIADNAIFLRQNYKLKTPDAIIAATAIVYDFTLVSRNDKDFIDIKELKYLNPF